MGKGASYAAAPAARVNGFAIRFREHGSLGEHLPASFGYAFGATCSTFAHGRGSFIILMNIVGRLEFAEPLD
jgi:hypothetical protein